MHLRIEAAPVRNTHKIPLRTARPFFSTIDQCSLLVVLILTKGVTSAVLMMENRAALGAFSTDRLDAVMLIAGQLVA